VPETVSYRIVSLLNGTRSVYSLVHRETFHPVIGPAAEADLLYVRQLRLRERLAAHEGEFVIWDVGLGAAANALAVLRATRDASVPLRIVSFDRTFEPLLFALTNSELLGYFTGYEKVINRLVDVGGAGFDDGQHRVTWEICLGDFASLLAGDQLVPLTKPHAILFDPHSPRRNPEMWTVGVFTNLYHQLAPQRPCTFATFSRSTMARTAMLLGGFFVGKGRPAGFKEETTVAANRLDLLDEPLGPSWLDRAKRSGSAEPMQEAVFQQLPLTRTTLERLRNHPQFSQNIA